MGEEITVLPMFFVLSMLLPPHLGQGTSVLLPIGMWSDLITEMDDHGTALKKHLASAVDFVLCRQLL